jgi:hypothetical protein
MARGPNKPTVVSEGTFSAPTPWRSSQKPKTRETKERREDDAIQAESRASARDGVQYRNERKNRQPHSRAAAGELGKRGRRKTGWVVRKRADTCALTVQQHMKHGSRSPLLYRTRGLFLRLLVNSRNPKINFPWSLAFELSTTMLNAS